ncbi:MAG: histidine phosphatase family protein [Cardiobacteriaceae bacterium]|nr:histidine phosphatase family protein [Cardiobacteriaceae bacterium]
MNRLFWRHAETGFALSDLERPLTARGQQQAQATAQWLLDQGIDYPIYASEALRGQQTAACYASPHILAGLNPDRGLAPVWQALDAICDTNAIIVGHMPWIGAAIARHLDIPAPFVGHSELYWLRHDGHAWQLHTRHPG